MRSADEWIAQGQQVVAVGGKFPSHHIVVTADDISAIQQDALEEAERVLLREIGPSEAYGQDDVVLVLKACLERIRELQESPA